MKFIPRCLYSYCCAVILCITTIISIACSICAILHSDIPIHQCRKPTSYRHCIVGFCDTVSYNSMELILRGMYLQLYYYYTVIYVHHYQISILCDYAVFRFIRANKTPLSVNVSCLSWCAAMMHCRYGVLLPKRMGRFKCVLLCQGSKLWDIFCLQVRLKAEVLCTPSSTRPRFKLVTSRSWQHTSCHWDACSNH